ncbi:hypothetical protein TrRE_jg11112 [Triparma retinervis]|uniref:ADP-ribosylation factor-like protein 6 n=1 Tax=Triparma retinervis TaxID=2557542 RepID=A0A9W7G5Y5_9STRA|nr:hypothetical protein TrRE_jg11112 [Triparma retinervis]
MGFFKKIQKAFGMLRQEVRILVIGLDNSGKTTLINHIKPSSSSTFEVTPTVGYNVEEFSKNNLNFTVFDMSGEGRYRNLWEHYYESVQAIIYVIDSTDSLRLCVSSDELSTLLSHPSLSSRSLPLLFFSNKMDVPGALSPVEVMKGMELEEIKDRPWHITASNAITGAGVEEGVAWLSEKIIENQERGGHK